MLKEIFLINQSVLQFHCSSERVTSEDDKAILSSGFLSAIQDFSVHARSDVLDSFFTESEYFLYSRFPNSDLVLVGIFNRKAPEKYARESIQKIMNIFHEIPLPKVDGLQWSDEVKEQIKKKVDWINIQYFGDEQLSAIAVELLEKRTDIPLAFLVDSMTNSIVAKFSRPKPLFKENQVREFLLVHSTLQKTLESLDIKDTYSYLIVESDDYCVVACNGGRLLSVASGSMQVTTENVYNAATHICYAEPLEFKIEQAPELGLISSMLIGADGRVILSSGKPLPEKANIFISTLTKNIDSMFTLITRRPYTQFFLRTKGESPKSLILKKTSKGIELQIHQL